MSMTRRQQPGAERGAALVEFALVSFVLYLLLAGVTEFGRMMYAANALQDVARVAARELSVTPLPASVTFDQLFACDATAANCQRRRVFDPACLVVDLTDPAVAADPDAFFAAMPVANRALRTLMISEPSRPNLLRYPGALLSTDADVPCSADGGGGLALPTGLTVGIPLVVSRDGAGVETITWVSVLEEIRGLQNVDCPARGPFSLTYPPATADACGNLPADPVPAGGRGLAAVRINYPYQAAMLSGFLPSLPTDADPIPPNLSTPVLADDGAVQQNNVPPGAPVDDVTAIGTYAGTYGLGRQYALAGRTVRPFRKVISAQAIYRREVYQ
jgi:hypothetical protein